MSEHVVVEKEIGGRTLRLETGKWADLIVVRGNPLEDIRNTR